MPRTLETDFMIARHGQSEWNRAGRWQGHADPPLSDLGREQARTAADALKGVEVVVCSDLQRAADTAMIICDSLGIDAPHIDPAFRERDLGICSGLTTPEIEARFPGLIEQGMLPPCFEPDHAMVARVMPALASALARAGRKRLLIVSHGGLIRAIERTIGPSETRLKNLEATLFAARGGTLIDFRRHSLLLG